MNKRARWLNLAALVVAVLGTVLLSRLDDSHWGAGCFAAALLCVSVATGRLP
jgi:hypothetical protein